MCNIAIRLFASSRGRKIDSILENSILVYLSSKSSEPSQAVFWHFPTGEKYFVNVEKFLFVEKVFYSIFEVLLNPPPLDKSLRFALLGEFSMKLSVTQKLYGTWCSSEIVEDRISHFKTVNTFSLKYRDIK